MNDMIKVHHTNNQFVMEDVASFIRGELENSYKGTCCNSNKTMIKLKMVDRVVLCPESIDCGLIPCRGCELIKAVGYESDTFIDWD